MQDIRQSEMYVEYMRKIGWIVEEIDGIKIFVKKFPLVGSMIKIQRPDRLPSVELIDAVARRYKAWHVSLEMMNDEGLMINDFKVNNNPYLPSKTIQIDLTLSEDEIFERFIKTKRWEVRRAMRNEVVVKESENIEEFIKLKSKAFWPMGYFMAKDVRALWESFQPSNTSTIIGYYNNKPIAGVLLLFYDGIGYYWMAASTDEGKKLFVPTHLVWEALRLAKEKGCKVFDFEGIYDERFHNATKKWKGFTRFKQGFGGKEVTFPEPLIRHYPPTLKLRRGFA